MSFQATRQSWLAAVDLIERVPARAGVGCSEIVRVQRRSDTIRLTLSSDVTGQATVKGQGAWPMEESYLDRRLLTPFLFVAKTKKPDGLIRVEPAQSGVCMIDGRRRVDLQSSQGVAGYGDWSGAKIEEVPLPVPIRKAVALAATCAMDLSVLPHLSCVWLGPDGAWSSNQRLIFHAFGKNAVNGWAIPLSIARVLSDAKIKVVYRSPDCTMLRFLAGRLWQTIPLKAQNEFPQGELARYLKEIGAERPIFSMPLKRLKGMVDRFLAYAAGVSREEWVLQLRGQKGSDALALTLSVPRARFDDTVPLQEKLRVDVDLSWPLDLLADVFSKMTPAGELTTKTLSGRTYVHSPEFEMMIAARRKGRS